MTRRLLPLLALCAAVPAAAQTAWVLTSDFTSGRLARVNSVTRAVTDPVAGVHGDARLRVIDDTVYVVNRFGADNVQLVNAATGATIRQFSTGNGSNPYDVALVAPRRLFVTRYESTDLWIMDPRTGAHTGTVSLAAFADADGVPEMDRLAVVGPYVFVSLQRVNRNAGFTATDTSLVAVIDARADTVVDCDAARPGRQAIVLARQNPATDFVSEPGVGLLIGCVGNYGVLDGGVVRVNPWMLAAGGTVITESALGGDVSDVEWGTAQKAYAIVSDANFDASLVSWNPATGQKRTTLWTPGGFSLADMTTGPDGRLWVCDNSFLAPGLHVFDTGTDTDTGAPMSFALPPVAVAFGSPAPPAAVGNAAPIALALSAPAPNPARGGTRVALTLAAPGPVDVAVFDVGGRRVRTLAEGLRPAGRIDLAWDTRDEAGRAAPPGVYLVMARVTGAEASTRIAVVR